MWREEEEKRIRARRTICTASPRKNSHTVGGELEETLSSLHSLSEKRRR